MAEEIPLSSDPFYDQRAVLDGREFLLKFQYNERIDRWDLSISSETDIILRSSIRLVLDFPLIRKRTRDDLPAGQLEVQAKSLGLGAVTLQAVQNRQVALIYIPISEVEGI